MIFHIRLQEVVSAQKDKEPGKQDAKVRHTSAVQRSRRRIFSTTPQSLPQDGVYIWCNLVDACLSEAVKGGEKQTSAGK